MGLPLLPARLADMCSWLPLKVVALLNACCASSKASHGFELHLARPAVFDAAGSPEERGQVHRTVQWGRAVVPCNH